MARALLFGVRSTVVCDIDPTTENLRELLSAWPEQAGVGIEWRMYAGEQNRRRPQPQNLSAWRLARQLGWRGEDAFCGPAIFFGAGRRRDIDLPDRVLATAQELGLLEVNAMPDRFMTARRLLRRRR